MSSQLHDKNWSKTIVFITTSLVNTRLQTPFIQKQKETICESSPYVTENLGYYPL